LYWQVPQSPASSDVVCAKFNSVTNFSQLAVVYANNTFVLYNVENMCLDAWSIANTERLHKLSNEFAGPFESISFGVHNDVYIHGQGFSARGDVSRDLEAEFDGRINRVNSNKLKHVATVTNGNTKDDSNTSSAIAVNTFVAGVGEGANPVVSKKPAAVDCNSNKQKRKRDNVQAGGKCLSIIELYRSIVYCKAQTDSSMVSH
jgi:hypothetical protein